MFSFEEIYMANREFVNLMFQCVPIAVGLIAFNRWVKVRIHNEKKMKDLIKRVNQAKK